MSKDCRGDHPEADPARALAGGGVAGLDGAVDALVRLRQGAATVGLRAGDPSEAGVEHFLRPCFGGRHVAGVLLGRALREHVDLIGALAEAGLAFGLERGVLRQETLRLLREPLLAHFQGLVCHRVSHVRTVVARLLAGLREVPAGPG